MQMAMLSPSTAGISWFLSSSTLVRTIGLVLLLSAVVQGAPSQAQVVDLFTLDGAEGFRFEGIDSFDRAGIAVRFLGDVNGDEIDDIAIGAESADPNGMSSGETYVVFGSPDGFPAVFDLSTLNGVNGFILHGPISPNRSGAAIAGAIDFNRDGFNDVVTGAPGNTVSPGYAYVVFGTDQGFPPVLELASLNGTNGFTIEGVALGDGTGLSLDNAGDVNSDGFDDLIIGANSADPGGPSSGAAYVLFGSDQGFPSVFSLSTLNGSNGFTIPGIDSEDRLGSSGGVSAAGDVNHDGIDDVLIGALGADPGGRTNAGEAYVIFGTDQGFPAIFNLASLNGANGFTLNGITSGDGFGDFAGSGVSEGVDVNHDGIDDILIGASAADPAPGRNDAGQTYVVFGTDQGFPTVFELSSLNGTNGFMLNGISRDDRSGRVSKAGDFNNDGVDDFLIGAGGSNANGPLSGQSYLIYGTDQGFPAVFELSSVDGINGLTFNGHSEGLNLRRDVSGAFVDGGGDLNADGVDDLVIGAPSVAPNPTNGRAYVVYGVPSFTIRLKRVVVTTRGVGKAVVKWQSADVSKNKVGIYVDGVFQKNTRNDNKVKVKFNNPNNGPFDIYLCEKNSTVCSNTVVADFTDAVIIGPDDPDFYDDDDDTYAGKGAGTEAAPSAFALQGNYPNPFNPITQIQVDLPERAEVSVAVYDVLGRQVLALPAHVLEAGAARSIAVDGSSLASGVYLYRLTARMESDRHVATGWMTLVR